MPNENHTRLHYFASEGVKMVYYLNQRACVYVGISVRRQVVRRLCNSNYHGKLKGLNREIGQLKYGFVSRSKGCEDNIRRGVHLHHNNLLRHQ